jgi:hypothetical protein
MVFQTNGNLTTDKRTVNDTTTWDTDTDWNAYQSKSGIQISNGVLKLAEGSTFTQISQENDADLSEWTGDLASYTTVTMPVVANSTHSIEYSTDSSEKVISKSFSSRQYSEYRFYIQSSDTNDEIIFYDGNSDDAVFCIFFQQYDLYVSDPWASRYDVTNSTGGDRTGGVSLGTINEGDWYEVVVVPDWGTSNITVTANSTTQTVSMLTSGSVPDTVDLTCNAGSASTGGYVDEIRVKE